MENPMNSRKSSNAVYATAAVGIVAAVLTYFGASETLITTISGMIAGVFSITILSQGHADANDDDYRMKE